MGRGKKINREYNSKGEKKKSWERATYLSGQWTIVANCFWCFCWLAAPYSTPEPAIKESYRFAEVLEDEDEAATLAGIQMHLYPY